MTLGILITVAAGILLLRPWRFEDPATRDYSTVLEACVVTFVLIYPLAQT